MITVLVSMTCYHRYTHDLPVAVADKIIDDKINKIAQSPYIIFCWRSCRLNCARNCKRVYMPTSHNYLSCNASPNVMLIIIHTKINPRKTWTLGRKDLVSMQLVMAKLQLNAGHAHTQLISSQLKKLFAIRYNEVKCCTC